MNHSLNEQLMARKAAATPRGVGVMAPFFAHRAEGAELFPLTTSEAVFAEALGLLRDAITTA